MRLLGLRLCRRENARRDRVDPFFFIGRPSDFLVQAITRVAQVRGTPAAAPRVVGCVIATPTVACEAPRTITCEERRVQRAPQIAGWLPRARREGTRIPPFLGTPLRAGAKRKSRRPGPVLVIPLLIKGPRPVERRILKTRTKPRAATKPALRKVGLPSATEQVATLGGITGRSSSLRHVPLPPEGVTAVTPVPRTAMKVRRSLGRKMEPAALMRTAVRVPG